MTDNTKNFKTVDYRDRPDIHVYESQLQRGWVLYVPPYAKEVYSPILGSHTVWETIFIRKKKSWFSNK